MKLVVLAVATIIAAVGLHGIKPHSGNEIAIPTAAAIAHLAPFMPTANAPKVVEPPVVTLQRPLLAIMVYQCDTLIALWLVWSDHAVRYDAQNPMSDITLTRALVSGAMAHDSFTATCRLRETQT